MSFILAILEALTFQLDKSLISKTLDNYKLGKFTFQGQMMDIFESVNNLDRQELTFVSQKKVSQICNYEGIKEDR